MRLAIFVALLALTLGVLVLWGISRIPEVHYPDKEIHGQLAPTDEMVMHFREMKRAEETNQ